MEQVRRHAEGAQVIAGTAIDEALADRLYVTLIASRPSTVPEQAGVKDLDPVEHPAKAASDDFETRRTIHDAGRRSYSGFVPNAPEFNQEQPGRLVARMGGGSLSRKQRLQQGVLPLEIVSRGRFEKSEPTIYRGEDLDVPTFIRHGVALN
jgi:cell division protein FtsZ